jgi:uncharacterized protein
MSMIKSFITGFILIIGFSFIYAQDIPDRPRPPRLVVDYSGILSSSEKMALENKLVRFNDTTSNQILVILTNDLHGYEISEFADRIGDKWGVGQAEMDNGIVVVIKPKIGNNRGQTWISVGHGLGGAIPDITAGQIVDFEMIPSFKNNDYYSGIDKATTVLMGLAAGEYSSDEYAGSRGNSPWTFLPIIIFFIIFFIISRLSRRSRTIGSRSMSPWTAFWVGSMMGSGGSSGGWGRSSGGGGFGGFGGGSFGGGGAGGSW